MHEVLQMLFPKPFKKIPKIRKTLKKFFLVMVIKPPSIFIEEQSSKGLGFFKDIFVI